VEFGDEQVVWPERPSGEEMSRICRNEEFPFLSGALKKERLNNAKLQRESHFVFVLSETRVIRIAFKLIVLLAR